MEGLEFEDKVNNNNFQNFYKKPKGLVAFFVNKGIFKDEKTATIFVLVIALIILAVAGFVLFNVYKTPKEVRYQDLSPSAKARIPYEGRMIFERRLNQN